jgi:membrane-associated phospholipid phosphatase
MPSIHVTIAVVTAAGIRETSRRRWARALAPAYPPLVAGVVLVTANHYLLDTVAGAALGRAALGAAKLLEG